MSHTNHICTLNVSCLFNNKLTVNMLFRSDYELLVILSVLSKHLEYVCIVPYTFRYFKNVEEKK